MPQQDSRDFQDTRTSNGSWRLNPLKERDETLAVLAAWHDPAQRPLHPAARHSIKLAAAAVLAVMAAWAATVAFPDLFRFLPGA